MPYADKTKLRIHRTWQNMIWRCYRKEHASYKYYGDRGITVCDEWQKFEPFYKWALANGYKNNLTIDRVNVNGNYEPSNCRWATPKQQANNKRTSRKITFNGETKTISEWAEILGISSQAMTERLNSPYWSVEAALTTPAKTRALKQPLFAKKVKQVSTEGKIIKTWNSISEAATALKIPNGNISRALKNPCYTAGGHHWEYA